MVKKNVGKENFGTADYNVTIFTGALCVVVIIMLTLIHRK